MHQLAVLAEDLDAVVQVDPTSLNVSSDAVSR